MRLILSSLPGDEKMMSGTELGFPKMFASAYSLAKRLGFDVFPDSPPALTVAGRTAQAVSSNVARYLDCCQLFWQRLEVRQKEETGRDFEDQAETDVVACVIRIADGLFEAAKAMHEEKTMLLASGAVMSSQWRERPADRQLTDAAWRVLKQLEYDAIRCLAMYTDTGRAELLGFPISKVLKSIEDGDALARTWLGVLEGFGCLSARFQQKQTNYNPMKGAPELGVSRMAPIDKHLLDTLLGDEVLRLATPCFEGSEHVPHPFPTTSVSTV